MSAEPIVAVSAKPKFVRNRVTYSLYAYFCTFGWFMLGFSPCVPIIAQEQNISNGQAGLIGPALALGLILGALAINRSTASLGRKRVLFSASTILTVGVIGLLLSSSFPLTVAATFVCAFGAELIIASVLPGLAVHHQAMAPAALSEGAAIGAAAGLASPFLVGLSISAGWGWRVGISTTIVLLVIACLFLAGMPRVGALDGRRLRSAAHPSAARPSKTTGVFWLLWVACICGIALEFSTLFWVPALFSERAGMSLGAAASSASALVLGELIARSISSRLSTRWTLRPLLLVALSVTALGWLIFWTASVPLIAVVGLFIAGLGIGPLQPLTAASLFSVSPGEETKAQSRISIGQGIAIGTFPIILGALSDVTGTFLAFLVIPALVILCAIMLVIATKKVHSAPAADSYVVAL